jgi:DNA-binding MarR family transcriptional regulator
MVSSASPPPAVIPDLHRRIPQYLARRFNQICNALLSEVSAPYGLMVWHFGLLVQIRGTPGMDRGWLAAAMGVDATSTGQALEQFEKRGLVMRVTKSNDRRASAFTLTAAGEALFTELAGPTRTVAQRLLEPLTEAEADTFLDLLGRLVDAHEAHARAGAGRRPPRPKKAKAIERVRA